MSEVTVPASLGETLVDRRGDRRGDPRGDRLGQSLGERLAGTLTGSGRARTSDASRRSAAVRRSRTAAVVRELAAVSVVGLAVSVVLALPAPAVALTAASWVAALAAVGHFRLPALGDARRAALARVARTGALALLVAVASAPTWTGADTPAALPALVTAHVLTSAALLAVARRRRTRIVLAGHPRDVREALVEMRSVDRDDVVAVCLTRRSSESFGDLPTYGGLGGALPALADHDADALVVLPGRHTSPTVLRRLQWDVAGAGREIYLGTGLVDVEPQRARVVSAAGLGLVHVAPAPLGCPRRRLKDVVERSTALLGLLLALPLLGVLCVLIRRESAGPALFRQVRIGRDGVPFTMVKLRTMSTHAEDERSGLAVANEKDGVLFKIRLDPRVTPLGRLLRRYSLDELPQLWNVVRGDMSLVGPRPALPDEVASYDLDPRRRLAVKPGITGLWQVSGRSDLTWAESVRLDLRYVDNWSLRLDLAILSRTVQAVVGHRGAY